MNESRGKSVAININHVEGATKKKQKSVAVLSFNLDHLSSGSQFLICSAVCICFYIVYGYVQELIFQLEDFKPFGWYLTLIQFAYYTVFGLIERKLENAPRRRVPFGSYIFLAFLTVATMGLSNASLGYLNYATQVIFKSCKLIPVLIGGIIIQGKRYGVIDLIACLCMSIGLIFFTLADSSVSPSFNVYGILLISLALCADAVIGNTQEKVMLKHESSNSEMILYCYSIGFVYLFVGLAFSGELFDAFSFCSTHIVETYGYAVIFSLTGYLGQSIVLTLVTSYGALVAVTVTTCRKAITVVLSFLIFTKPFTVQYIWSGLIVVLGIYLNIYSKNRTKWNASMLNYLRLVVSITKSLLPRHRASHSEQHIV